MQASPEMAKTHHYRARLSQRGIRETTVRLALNYGDSYGDKVVLGRQQIRKALQGVDELRKELVRAMDKGGVVVVESGGVLVTAYDRDSHARY